MELPDKIKITDYDFNVYRVERNDEYLGETQADNLTIKVTEGIDDKIQAMVLLHEVLHAVAYCYGIKFDSAEQEEYIVNGFGLAMFHVLRNNPQLLNCIMNAK